MYRSFFEMERMPFVRDVPIQELYESPAMSEALGRLAYAADHQLFAVVTADGIFVFGISWLLDIVCFEVDVLFLWSY